MVPSGSCDVDPRRPRGGDHEVAELHVGQLLADDEGAARRVGHRARRRGWLRRAAARARGGARRGSRGAARAGGDTRRPARSARAAPARSRRAPPRYARCRPRRRPTRSRARPRGSGDRCRRSRCARRCTPWPRSSRCAPRRRSWSRATPRWLRGPPAGRRSSMRLPSQSRQDQRAGRLDGGAEEQIAIEIVEIGRPGGGREPLHGVAAKHGETIEPFGQHASRTYTSPLATTKPTACRRRCFSPPTR